METKERIIKSVKIVKLNGWTAKNKPKAVYMRISNVEFLV